MASCRVDGARALRQRLEARRRAVTDLGRFLGALAQGGADVAQARFNAAYYSGDKTVSVTVNRRSDTEYEVVASGQSVMFIEFGSGVSYSHDNPLQPAGWDAGSWSATHKDAITPWGEWVYAGVGDGDAEPVGGHRDGVWWTHGNPSANAMYEASKDMRAQIGAAWRQTFGGV